MEIIHTDSEVSSKKPRYRRRTCPIRGLCILFRSIGNKKRSLLRECCKSSIEQLPEDMQELLSYVTVKGVVITAKQSFMKHFRNRKLKFKDSTFFTAKFVEVGTSQSEQIRKKVKETKEDKKTELDAHVMVFGKYFEEALQNKAGGERKIAMSSHKPLYIRFLQGNRCFRNVILNRTSNNDVFAGNNC